ncbi:MAG: methyltransferase domain-containing protein [Verrucomicrobiota bacterium]
MTEAEKIYTSGEYAERHQEWHLEDAPAKAQDILPYVKEVIGLQNSQNKGRECRIADIGAGVGGVIVELQKFLASDNTQELSCKFSGYEISEHAVKQGKQMFPQLDLVNKALQENDGPFDATMFIDVLEHLENPHEMVRLARKVSDFMIVRQPLLESFATFRHANYQNQRMQWGHIAFFNSESFIDLAASQGWNVFAGRLLAPWELATGNNSRPNLAQNLFTSLNRRIASQFISGFYWVGAFQRDDTT